MKPIFFLFGVFLFIFALRYILFFKNHPPYKVGQKLDVIETLLTEPKIVRNSQVFFLDGVKVRASPNLDLHYGTSIRVSGIVGKEQEVLTLKNSQVQILKKSEESIFAPLFSIRKQVSSAFSHHLNKNGSDLLLGVVFGIKGNIDHVFYKQLKQVGVLHVIAASGMNVSMVGGFLEGMGLLLFKRSVAFAITIVGVLLYAILAGLEASIVRASIMALFAYGAQVLGRQKDSYISLFLAAFVMLMIDPALINDLSFQLSFASTLGIVGIKPLFPKSTFLDDLTTTISAQVATLPIIVTHFSSYSLLSILTNALLLWTIPPLMILGGIASLAALFSPALSAPFLYLSYPFLFFFEHTVVFFASFSAVTSLEDITLTLVVGYYLIVAAMILYFSKSVKQKSRKNSVISVQRNVKRSSRV